MTFEKVLKVFDAYLSSDDACEIILTRHGYTLLVWDERGEEWYGVEYCPTPESLRDRIASVFCDYMQDNTTHGTRDLTPEEMASIQAQAEALVARCSRDESPGEL